jgi:acetyl esterase
MSLHPEAKAALEELRRLGGPVETVAEARAVRIRMAQGLEAEPVASVEEVGIPGPGGNLKVRIYRPEARPGGILVYFHGGGWVVGNLDTHDAGCRALANATPCVVVSVDYRLAPEHKFPAAVEDAYAATVWAFENRAGLLGRGSRVAVGGDSAGGNLAAVVALMARERGTPEVAYQLLIYPVTDYNLDTESYRAYGEGYFLTRQKMAWYWELYLREEADG